MNYVLAYAEVINALLSGKVVKATKYVHERLIIRAVIKRYHGKILAGHNKEITLTIGKPNYMEREFIQLCKKSGESFPVKKVQLKLYNPPKKKLTPSRKSPPHKPNEIGII